MQKIEFEEWRMKEIGALMIEADELSLGSDERQRLFIDISHSIACFGLYETSEKVIKEIVEKFSNRLCPQLKGESS